MNRGYHIELKPLPPDEGGGFLAWVPDLPGCASDGATRSEALENAAEAIDEWIEEAQRLGRAIPEPPASERPIPKGYFHPQSFSRSRSGPSAAWGTRAERP
jgi:antitoxin HicB